jgi:ankyrin repeat protein
MAGRVGAVSALIACGANLGAGDGDVGTALHWAVAHINVVAVLLGAGVDVNARDGRGDAALYLATLQGRPGAEVVRALHAADGGRMAPPRQPEMTERVIWGQS